MASSRALREVCFADVDDDGEASVKTDWARDRSGYFKYCGSPIVKECRERTRKGVLSDGES